MKQGDSSQFYWQTDKMIQLIIKSPLVINSSVCSFSLMFCFAHTWNIIVSATRMRKENERYANYIFYSNTKKNKINKFTLNMKKVSKGHLTTWITRTHASCMLFLFLSFLVVAVAATVDAVFRNWDNQYGFRIYRVTVHGHHYWMI